MRTLTTNFAKLVAFKEVKSSLVLYLSTHGTQINNLRSSAMINDCKSDAYKTNPTDFISFSLFSGLILNNINTDNI